MAIDIPESPVGLVGTDDQRLFSPAAARNLHPITNILAEHVTGSGTILELASGSGEHIVHFAMRFPEISWQPSDICDKRLASIRAWKETQMLANIAEPMFLDVTAPNKDMAAKKFSAVICVNLLHLISDGASEQTLAFMVSSVVEEGFVFFYGPFRRGCHLPPMEIGLFMRTLQRRIAQSVSKICIVLSTIYATNVGMTRSLSRYRETTSRLFPTAGEWTLQN